jgi:hypothetical protein
VQGLNEQLDLKKIIKAVKKTHCCNGTIVEDEEMGQVLQFQGDQRDNVLKFLLENGEQPEAGACVCCRVRRAGPSRVPVLETIAAQHLTHTHVCCAQSLPTSRRSRSTATAKPRAAAGSARSGLRGLGWFARRRQVLPRRLAVGFDPMAQPDLGSVQRRQLRPWCGAP